MKAETLEFQLDQPIPDPLRPGESTAVPTRVTVPLLSLLNIPSVRVKEADISFLVHVSQTIEGERPTRIGRSFGREVELRGVYGARGDRNARPSLSLQLRLESTPEGEPLERVKRLLGDATMAVAEPTSKSKSAKPGSARVAPRRSTGPG